MQATTKIVATLLTTTMSLVLCGSAFAQSKPDRFLLPQPDQPFEGKVDTRIGTLEFTNQYPSKESMETLLDNMDFHGATQAYLWAIPIVDFANIQYFNDEVLKVRQGEMIDFPELKYNLGILTANATTPYIIGTADLTKTGPLVIEMPVGASAGMVDDFWQRPITDIGLPGPDKGKGAKYLITPPGFSSQKPDGYLVHPSPTNNILIGFRILDTDPAKAKSLKDGFRVYAYKNRAHPSKSAYPLPSAAYYYGPPRGMAFWERLHEILNREVVAERDRLYMALLRRVGIEKGKPFKPDARQRKILGEAAFVGEAMAKANDLAKRDTPAYWPGASWKVALGLDPSQRAEFYDQLDERAAWMYEAISTSQGMVTTTPGLGSIYLATYADKDGDWLEGGKHYTLRVPPNPPAEQFWSIAVYSWDTRTLINNKQKRANLSSRQGLVKNADGSVDLYFGPTAPTGKDKNWVQTIPGQGWWVYLRFYAPTKAYFDKSWAMPDFEKLK
jgi:hypothetical protein